MNKLLSTIKNTARKLRYQLPSNLPKGMKELEDFSATIFSTYDLPNEPSYKHTLATMIMHLGPTTYRVPKAYFADSIRKAMANQIAYAMIQNIRDQEKREAAPTTEEPKLEETHTAGN